jgi:hypothetical protein
MVRWRGSSLVRSRAFAFTPRITRWVEEHGGGLMFPLSIAFEEELAALKKACDVEGAAALLATVDGGLVRQKSVLPRVIKCGYAQLSLIYYFTVGEKEVRCWTVAKGSTAPQAAGVIHSDFERGFIKVREQYPQAAQNLVLNSNAHNYPDDAVETLEKGPQARSNTYCTGTPGSFKNGIGKLSLLQRISIVVGSANTDERFFV